MKKIISLLFVVWFSAWCYGQKVEGKGLMFYFRPGSVTLDINYMSNQAAITKFISVLTPSAVQNVKSISIEGYASPEGNENFNKRLSMDRATAVKRYMIANFPWIPIEKIKLKEGGENWKGLRDLVSADFSTPRRDEVLAIIDTDFSNKSQDYNFLRKKAIMDLGYQSWSYMLRNHFPKLRIGVTVTLALDTIRINHISDSLKEQIKEKVDLIKTDTVTIYKTDTMLIERVDTLLLKEKRVRKPLFAIKTNLLFDLVTALNVELEVPIGKRWSIAGEYIFPWWLWDKKQYCIQNISGNLEGRYWLGNRNSKKLLTGYFAGIYGGGGYFDFEHKTKGYQGEYYSAGVTGGYAHTINKSGSLRMEYSLGIGYAGIKYRKYSPKYGYDGEWHLVKQNNGVFRWIGPTRAKISLVWML